MAQRVSLDHITLSSTAPNDERIAALRELFPEAFSEGQIDWERLHAALGDAVDERPERYSFTWAGKRDAMRLLQMPTRATLAPAEGESVNWDTTHHVFIEGDNLEALKLLYKPYFGRVKMIYIDPPYNTGNDFIYPDDFADPLGAYLTLTGQQDEGGNLLTSNPETSGRYHSAWLSMMYPRLFLARQLLREDGVIFVSIDDHEVHNLRLLMNEVFGEENFITTVIWQKIFSPKNTARHFSEDHDYVLVYARNGDLWQPNLLPRTDEADARYTNPDNDPRGPWSSSDLTARNYYGEGRYEVTSPSGKTFGPPTGRYWAMNKATFLQLDQEGRIWWGANGSNMPRQKLYLSEVKQGIVPQTLWLCNAVGHTQEAKKELLDVVQFEHTDNVLNTVKPTRLLQRMLQIVTNPTKSDLVLDFFSGSASMAHAVLKQNREDGGNRHFICAQFPELLPIPEVALKTIADIGKERISRAIAKLAGGGGNSSAIPLFHDGQPPEDLGFRVFKLAPSNVRAWQGVAAPDADAYGEQMALFNDLLVGAWQPEGVIWEAALKEGFSLDARVERVDGCTANAVYRVTDPDRAQAFYICLDAELRQETPAALGLSRDDLFICRDAALSDELAANLALQCRLKVL